LKVQTSLPPHVHYRGRQFRAPPFPLSVYPSIASIPLAMSLGGLRDARSLWELMESTSDIAVVSNRPSQTHPKTAASFKNKAESASYHDHDHQHHHSFTSASTFTPSHTASPHPQLYPHASAIAGSEASSTSSQSKLTTSSLSSRDSLPSQSPLAVDVHRQTTPQKHAKKPKRTKGQKSNKWNRGGGASPIGTSTANRSPQSSRLQHQNSHTLIASSNAAAHQGRLMAATSGGPLPGDSRRGVLSPRPKGRGRLAHNPA
jgi:hypothetical protein